MTTVTVTRTLPAPAPDRGRGPDVRRGLVAIGAATVLVVVVHVWGRWLQARGHQLFVNLPPLVGHLDLRLAWQAFAAPALGVAAVVWGPRLAGRLTWRRLLWVAFAAAAAWAISLALTEGLSGFLRSPSGRRDYLHDVPQIGSPLEFLRTYVDEIDRYATHVRAHPPAMVLLAWAIARAGGGPALLGAVEVAAAASAVPAALLSLRAVTGEDRARAAAPFLAFAPAAMTMASSGDAFFTGVGAWAVALVVLAIIRAGRRGDAMAIGGGLLFSAVAFLSYGLVLLAVIPIGVAGARRRWRAIGVAAFAAVPAFLAVLAAGFWWVEGLLATRVEYLESVARSRPYWYFLVANVAAFCLILGPATIAGAAMLRSRSTWLLVGGALAAVVLADLSGMSKAEAERIWLPFAPWVLLATSALPRASSRSWLALNVAFGLALELAVWQPW